VIHDRAPIRVGKRKKKSLFDKYSHDEVYFVVSGFTGGVPGRWQVRFDSGNPAAMAIFAHRVYGDRT